MFYLAKYYPSSNWQANFFNKDEFWDFFDKHAHEKLDMRGPIHFELTFEFDEYCPSDFFGYLGRKICGPNRFTGGE